MLLRRRCERILDWVLGPRSLDFDERERRPRSEPRLARRSRFRLVAGGRDCVRLSQAGCGQVWPDGEIGLDEPFVPHGVVAARSPDPAFAASAPSAAAMSSSGLLDNRPSLEIGPQARTSTLRTGFPIGPIGANGAVTKPSPKTPDKTPCGSMGAGEAIRLSQMCSVSSRLS